MKHWACFFYGLLYYSIIGSSQSSNKANLAQWTGSSLFALRSMAAALLSSGSCGYTSSFYHTASSSITRSNGHIYYLLPQSGYIAESPPMNIFLPGADKIKDVHSVPFRLNFCGKMTGRSSVHYKTSSSTTAHSNRVLRFCRIIAQYSRCAPRRGLLSLFHLGLQRYDGLMIQMVKWSWR